MGLISRVSSRTYSYQKNMSQKTSNIPPPGLNLDDMDLSQIPWYRAENSVKNPLDFISAIKWSEEKSLQILLLFHTFISLLIIYSWNNSNYRIPLWLFIICLAFGTEKLNEACAKYYKELGFTEQYFDSSGRFILLIWAVPMMVFLGVLTFKMLKDLWDTLIETKVKQIRHQKRVKKAAEKEKEEEKAKETKKDQ